MLWHCGIAVILLACKMPIALAWHGSEMTYEQLNHITSHRLVSYRAQGESRCLLTSPDTAPPPPPIQSHLQVNKTRNCRHILSFFQIKYKKMKENVLPFSSSGATTIGGKI